MASPQLNVLISTLGSFGDMHPFLAIGKTLKQRGHHVRICAPAMYEELTRAVGLEFTPVGTIEEFEKFSSREDLWRPTTGFKVIAEAVGESMNAYFRAIESHHLPGQTVQVLSSLLFAGRVAQERLGIPTVTVHLAPSILRSVIEPAYLPPFPIAKWQPMWFRRFLYFALDELILDRGLGPPVNRFRTSIGMKPVRKVFSEWAHSPDRIIGLFPAWFAPPPPDWPKQTVLTGFPLYDESDLVSLDADLERFLNEGDAPIAFTPGSAMRHGRAFFQTAIDTCTTLKRRGLLLTRFAENIPPHLPEGVRHVVFAPFSKLLPRCAALVHHGGIGTASQGLAAGIPQVVVTMAHEQADNGRLLTNLGVAQVVPHPKFTPKTAVRAISKVLGDHCKTRCKQVATFFDGTDPLSDSAAIIEETFLNHSRTAKTANFHV